MIDTLRSKIDVVRSLGVNGSRCYAYATAPISWLRIAVTVCPKELTG